MSPRRSRAGVGAPSGRHPQAGASVAQILRHGDHGLGELDDGGGDFVVVRGHCFALRPDSSAVQADRRARATVAAVTRFRPDHRIAVRRPHSLTQLLPRIEIALADDEAAAAVRIDGWFSFVRVHAEPPREFSDVVGTIVGLRNADVDADASSGGLRLHFIDETRQVGGRVADFEVLRAQAELARVAPVAPRA